MPNDLTLYDLHRPQMRTGDLLTYETDGIVSSLIHLWSKANHAGLVLAPSEYEGETHRRWTLEAVGTGVRVAYLSDLLANLHGRCYWHPLKPEFDSVRSEIGAWALCQSGVVKYDFWSLFKWPFKAVSADLSKLICSEYVFLAWKSQGLVTGDSIPSPSVLETLGVTLPPILIVDSGPVVYEDHPVTV